MIINTSSNSPEQPGTPAFDPVAAGAEIDRAYDLWQSAENLAVEKAETASRLKADLTRLLTRAKGQVPDFKAFVARHTHIARSTAYRLLAIDEGQGDEVRAQECERQQRHRADQSVSVTRLVTDTPPAAVGGDDGDPEKPTTERQAANGSLDECTPRPAYRGNGDTKQIKRGTPEWYLSNFKYACRAYLPKLPPEMLAEAKE